MTLYKRLLTQLDGKMVPALRVAYRDVGKGREQGCGSFAYRDGIDYSRQSLCISTIHGGHGKGRSQGCGSFAYREVGKMREHGCGSFDWHYFRGYRNHLISINRPLCAP